MTGILEECCPQCGKRDRWRYSLQTCARCEKINKLQRVVQWRVPNGEVPDGVLLVEVDTREGSDVALVLIDEDENTLLETEYEDVWTSWTWKDVSRYALLEDILAVR